MTVLYVRFKDPTPALPCPECKGKGVAGRRYSMHLDDDRIMEVDAFCTSCGGCGSAVHDACPPRAHATLDEDEDYLNDAPSDACPSCGGRGWHVVMGWPPEVVDDTETVLVRVPCGCVEDRAEQLDILAGAAS